MNTNDFSANIEHWKFTAPLLRMPVDGDDFEQLVAAVDFLLDQIGEDENHSLMPILDVLSDHIEAYERINYPMLGEATGVDMVRHLMQVNGLRQSDLPEIGSQGVVSEVLSGKRELNLRQSKALAERFGLPLSNFLGD